MDFPVATSISLNGTSFIIGSRLKVGHRDLYEKDAEKVTLKPHFHSFNYSKFQANMSTSSFSPREQDLSLGKTLATYLFLYFIMS